MTTSNSFITRSWAKSVNNNSVYRYKILRNRVIQIQYVPRKYLLTTIDVPNLREQQVCPCFNSCANQNWFKRELIFKSPFIGHPSP